MATLVVQDMQHQLLVLQSLISKPLEFTGAAQDQVAEVARKASKLVASSPEAGNYRPEPIL